MILFPIVGLFCLLNGWWIDAAIFGGLTVLCLWYHSREAWRGVG